MIAPEEALEGVRLSPQQKRLWLLQQEEGGAIYRTRATVRIEGPLDTAAFEKAFEELVERHEILRTSFSCLRGVRLPLQLIRETGGLSFAWRDASDPGMAEPFDLESGPWLRVVCSTLSPDRHVCRIELPALCADAGGPANRTIKAARSGR